MGNGLAQSYKRSSTSLQAAQTTHKISKQSSSQERSNLQQLSKKKSQKSYASWDVKVAEGYPMRLIRFETFKSLNAIPRSDANIKWIDFDDIQDRGSAFVVFVSHQWSQPNFNPLWAQPDIDGTKFKIIVQSLNDLSHSLVNIQIYIWIDFFSIDQNDSEQRLRGIRMLPTYITNSDALYTPLDEQLSKNKGEESEFSSAISEMANGGRFQCLANLPDEYFGRGWTRLELYLCSHLPLPDLGYDYFLKMSVERTGRPHFFSIKSTEESISTYIFPEVGCCWFCKLDPTTGSFTNREDLQLVKEILKSLPQSCRNDKKILYQECTPLMVTTDIRYSTSDIDGSFTVPSPKSISSFRLSSPKSTHSNRTFSKTGRSCSNSSSVFGDVFEKAKSFRRNATCQTTVKKEDDWEGEIMDGTGTVYFSNGDRYEGELKEGLRNGYGILYVNNCPTYEGQWKNGMYHGTGLHSCADGSRYRGHFNNNMWHGDGTYYSPDGNRYEGEWKQGKMHGVGTLFMANGEIYHGKFKDNEFQDV